MAQGTKIANKQLFYNSKIAFESPGYRIENLLAGTGPLHAVNKAQLDAAVSGFNVHPAVVIESVVAGTFPGDFQAGDTVNGHVLVLGDRILITAQTDPKENGIYQITSAGPVRPDDADGTPVGEIRAGDIIFATESGNTYTLLVDGVDADLIPGVNNMNWTLFGSSMTYTASTGIDLTAGLFTLDFTNLTTAVPATADTIAFYDASGTAMRKSTITSFLNDLDIVNGITANGFTTRTAAYTYTSRTFVASTVGSRLGVNIQNGDGISGNPEIGVSILSLAVLGAVDQTQDYVMVVDATDSTNKRVTIGELGFGNYVNSITVDGNLLDSSTHAITITSGNGIESAVAANDITFNLDLRANSGLVFNGIELSLDLGASAITGFLAPTDGGTGLVAYTTGDTLYASAANVLSTLAIGTTGQVLTVSAGGVPVWSAANAGDITGVTAGSGLTGGGTSGDVTVNVGAGDGILVNADDVTINLGAGSTGNGLTKVAGVGGNQLSILIDALSDTGNLVSALAISSGALKVQVDNSTINTNVSGQLQVGSITASLVSDFAAKAREAVFVVGRFVDSASIDFTVTPGASVTAVVKSDSINDVQLATTNVGTIGQVLTLGNSAGDLTYVDASVVPLDGYNEAVSENATDMNNDNGGGVITAVVGITDVFGATNPIATGRPMCYINGVFTPVSSANTGAVFFSNGTSAPFTAVALGSLAGTENLIVNTDGLGYNIAVTDNIALIWKY